MSTEEILTELRAMLKDEPFDNFMWKKASLKSRVMAMMLNGQMDWDDGARLRKIIDTLEERNGQPQHTDNGPAG